MSNIKIDSYQHAEDRGSTIAARFPEPSIMERHAVEGIMREIVELVARRYVEENYAALVSKLDQQAIANLAIAESGKKIAEEIKTRPVVIREKGDTFIKRSIF